MTNTRLLPEAVPEAVRAKFDRQQATLDECTSRWNDGDGKRVNDVLEIARELLAQVPSWWECLLELEATTDRILEIGDPKVTQSCIRGHLTPAMNSILDKIANRLLPMAPVQPLNTIEAMSGVEPSPESWRLLDERCGLCNGTCGERFDHAMRIEVVLLRAHCETLKNDALLELYQKSFRIEGQ